MILREIFATTPLDRESLPQGSLDIAERVRTNPFPWTGQFSPQLVEELLSAYAPPTGVILDPFVGSGTSLVEAARLGLAACGGELNPAAVLLARVYQMINLGEGGRAAALDGLRNRIFKAVGPPYGPLFCDGAQQPLDRAALEAALVGLWRESGPGPARSLAAALVVLCDFHRKHLDADTVHETWLRIERTVRALPESARPIAVHHADARALPVESGSVDLVLTSPPYINVHNYHQKFRRSVEALEWDVLSVARSEIGSNRQNRGNRFLTIVQYALDMVLALREMTRAARSGARLILVLGRESSVRGVRFFNGELVAELAVRGVGLEFERRQERVFRNRYGGRHLRGHPACARDARSPRRRLLLDGGAEYRGAGALGDPPPRSPCTAAGTRERDRPSRPGLAVSDADPRGAFALICLTMDHPAPHGDKLRALLGNDKLPAGDQPGVCTAIERYEAWIAEVEGAEGVGERLIEPLVASLNRYKVSIDLDLVFDSGDDFLYRQKGQLKLDNTVLEEFLPRLVGRVFSDRLAESGLILGPTNAFAQLRFDSDLLNAMAGGGMAVRSKDQDFAMARRCTSRPHTARTSASLAKQGRISPT